MITQKNILNGIAIVGVLIVIWLGFDSFFSLVGNLYEFLDGFIWAFFAGVIAFLVSIWLVTIMFYISVFTFAFILVGIGTIVAAMSGGSK